MKIALDAGHGYKGTQHTGASGNGLVEDDVALDFMTRIGHQLRLLGAETYYTRPTKSFVSLGSRGAGAKAAECSFFLSIHNNAASASAASGVEIFCSAGDKRSYQTAGKILDAVVEASGWKNRGVKWDNQSQHSSLRVLRDTYRSMPAMLIELGFLTNTNDANKLKDNKFREKVATIIAKEIYH